MKFEIFYGNIYIIAVFTRNCFGVH